MIKNFWIAVMLFCISLIALPSAQAADEFCINTISTLRTSSVKVWDSVVWQLQASNPIVDSKGFTTYTITGKALNSFRDPGIVSGVAYTQPGIYSVRLDLNTKLELLSQPKPTYTTETFFYRPLEFSIQTLPISVLQTPVPGVVAGTGAFGFTGTAMGNPVKVAPVPCSTFGTIFF